MQGNFMNLTGNSSFVFESIILEFTGILTANIIIYVSEFMKLELQVRKNLI